VNVLNGKLARLRFASLTFAAASVASGSLLNEERGSARASGEPNLLANSEVFAEVMRTNFRRF
jgi:hypothetical protein